MQLHTVLLIVSIVVDSGRVGTYQPNYDDWSDRTDEDHNNNVDDHYDDRQLNSQQEDEEESSVTPPLDKEYSDPNDIANSESQADYDNEDEDYALEDEISTESDDYLQDELMNNINAQQDTVGQSEQVPQPKTSPTDNISNKEGYKSLVVKVYRGPTQIINQKPFASWSYFIQYPTEQSKASN